MGEFILTEKKEKKMLSLENFQVDLDRLIYY